MSGEWLAREEALIGVDAVRRLERASILLFGAGGVGSFALEALVRAGIGRITVVDGDDFSESNLNRQLLATTQTLGMKKVSAAAERARSINPAIDMRTVDEFASGDNLESIITDAAPDYIIDAIDSVTVKLQIAHYAHTHDLRLIASMGTGNKLDPSRFRITDITKTAVCPLARIMRRELAKIGVAHLEVLFSDEQPVHTGRRTPASVSYVPACAGLMIAGHCIRRLAQI